MLQGVRLHGVAFSPDSNILAAASKDGSVRLWQASSSVWLTDLLNGHQNIAYSLAFHPDSKTLAASSEDRVVTLWVAEGGEVEKWSALDTVCGKANRTFKPDKWAVYTGTRMSYRAPCPRLPFVPAGRAGTSQRTDRTPP